jgi:alkylation response protein AidB-like acyl-CoA dehydrogenase
MNATATKADEDEAASPILTDEQRSLRDAVRDLLGSRAGRASRRAYVDEQRPYDAELWGLMATGLGLHGVLIDARYGGAGGTLLDMSVIAEETGAELLCGPFFATAVLAVSAIAASESDEAKTQLLPAIAAGELTCAVVFPSMTNVAPVRAERHCEGWALSGTAKHVINGSDADRLIVAADTADGLAMFVVSAEDHGVERDDPPALDVTRRLTTVTFSGASAKRIAGESESVWADVLRTARIALAAEQVGVAQRCLDMSVDHARGRHQFGRPIGSFQAVKHRCADMYLDVTSARAVVHHAAWAAATDPVGFNRAAVAAGVVAAEAAVRVAASAVQVHGAISYTWEHDAHLYLKRALASARVLGTVMDQRESLAGLIGL